MCCDCSKDSICQNSNQANRCKGLVSTKQTRLNRDSLDKIASMISEMHQRVNVKIAENNRPQLANSISLKLKEHRLSELP